MSLNKDLEEIIKVRTNSQFTSPYATIKLTRREKFKSSKTLRPDGIAEVQKIIAVPYLFRCFNKTQVHPFIKNNITHRGEHIFYVSSIARNLSYLLGLNEYLTEAIALAHDIGHPPFSHMGEKYLNEILQKNFNMTFYHNIQSSRVLNNIFFALNFSFQTIEGALRHNSPLTENTLKTSTAPKNCFDEIRDDITNAFFNNEMPKRKMPTTLEAIVVRLSDIIAYIGKDRQDNKHITKSELLYNQTLLGESNNEIINNIIIDILELSS